MDTPGIEPGTFCMQSRRDTPTPRALLKSRLSPGMRRPQWVNFSPGNITVAIDQVCSHIFT
jgi:hypothetical protein